MSISSRTAKGFTLIELLIVMIIMGLSLSLVGGINFTQVDAAKRLQEREFIFSLLDEIRFQAMQSQNSYQITLSGNQVKISRLPAFLLTATLPDNDSETLQVWQTSYLNFPAQQLEVNANGFWSKAEISWAPQSAPERTRTHKLSGIGSQYAN